MARALACPEDPRPLPGWLLEHQRPLVRRLLPVLRQRGGALLAAPVGSGKTYMALAAAMLWSPSPAMALVPAILVPQWQRTATALGLEISLWSHERLSRGGLPDRLAHRDRGLVIVDESHRFRNPGSRRYQHLAPALIGRTVLLLSATPVVNRLADLAHQLLLCVRDDTLVPFGIPSLVEHLGNEAEMDSALGTLVLTGRDLGDKPQRRGRRARGNSDDEFLESTCAAIDSLALARDVATAGLIRIVLWRALASSPAALLGVLRRYRGLLRHAAEAAAGGRIMDRSALRKFIGHAPDQLMMWQLMPDHSGSSDLDLNDLRILDCLEERVVARSRLPDEKCQRLGEQLESGRTIVFTGARETVRYLREHLKPGPIAWCTGESAGIGHTRMPHDQVLNWFGPGSNGNGPRVLVTTDVASEGLDLQRAERVVHYDLPWTTVRLDQRDGRAIRLGSEHGEVQVIRFDPPAILRDRLRQVPILARKRTLPRRAGLIGSAARSWRWRDEIAVLGGGSGPTGRWAAVSATSAGVLAGFTIVLPPHQECAPVLGWLDGEGNWSEHPAVVSRMLAVVREAAGIADPGDEMLNHALRMLSPIVQSRLQAARRARWSAPQLGSSATALVTRLNALAGRAARDRDSARLVLLERALRFCGRGHTAGEGRWIQSLLALSDARLVEHIARCPPPDPDPLPVVRLNGLIVLVASQ